MVREGDRVFPDTHGGDNLWRTGLGYIAWGDAKLKEAILSCFVEGKDGKIEKTFRTAEGYGDDTCSRDQITMALAALKVRGDKEELKKLVPKLKRRISPKYTHSLDSWAWTKDLIGECKFPLHLLMVFFYTFAAYYNRLFGGKTFPSYAQHLTAWVIYTSRPWFGLRRLAQKFFLTSVEKQNVMLRLLCEDKTLMEWNFDFIVPYTGFQWQRWMAESNHRIAMRPLTEEEASQNVLSMDIVHYLKEKIYPNMPLNDL